jgi:gas vesicle protein
MSEGVNSREAYFLVIGISIGSLVGILFAPKSGEETREIIAKKAKEGSEFAQNKARELKERALDLVEQGNQLVARKQEQFASAIQAGRSAYQREIANARTDAD